MNQSSVIAFGCMGKRELKIEFENEFSFSDNTLAISHSKKKKNTFMGMSSESKSERNEAFAETPLSLKFLRKIYINKFDSK